MTLISVVQISKAYPKRVVLSDVSFGVDDGDRIGIIGSNGSGKSTLLSIIAGTLPPDRGEVVRRSGTRVAYLEQAPTFVASDTIGSVATGQDMIGYLDRLGISDLDCALGALSGGQLRRVALARALADESEVLILDEPTNHLDIDVIDWLEDEIARRTGAVIMVTHDRYLLDRVATRVFEVYESNLFGYRGDYQDFLEARAMREAQVELSERKRRNLARIELEWLNRRPKARTTKAKARVERATELIATQGPPLKPGLEFDFPIARLGSRIVELDDAGVFYGDHRVLEGVTFRLGSGARVGLVGPNGSGKTTLLSLLGGRLAPTLGRAVIGETVVSGWYGQDPQPLSPTLRILQVIEEIAIQTKLATGITVSAGQLLLRFGFSSPQHAGQVSDLSGGERRRLELLMVLARAPNLLLLDEPTNDLDLDTLGALEAYLDDWPGVVVTASHDRYFLDRVCKDVVSVEPDGSIRHHPGGYQAYLSARTKPRSNTTPKQSTTRPNTAAPKPTYKDRKEFERMEAEIPLLEAAVASLVTQLAGSDWARATAISQQLDTARRRLASAEERWLELSERL